MGLKDFFKSKDCDVCGEKIKLLGNRKLEDGNMCSQCAKKLSPFFSERRQSTLAEIKEQLQYRAENEQQLNYFTPTRIFGNHTKIMIDETSRQFIVTSRKNWEEGNPDLIRLDQVTYCNLDVEEDKNEIYREVDGKRESYEPRRYEYEYAFWIEIGIQSPWFDKIRFELSTTRPEKRYDRSFKEYERQGEEIRAYMSSRGQVFDPSGAHVQQAYVAPVVERPPMQAAPMGAAAATGITGVPAPEQVSRPKFCPNCGSSLAEVSATSRFCPECGSPL